MQKIKTSVIWKTSDRRMKPSEIWDKRAVVQHTWVPLALQHSSLFCRHAVHFRFFPNTIFKVLLKCLIVGTQNYVWDF